MITYKIAPGLFLSKKRKEIYLYDASKSQVYIFTGTSSLIIQGIHKGASINDILEKICDSYQVTRAHAATDTQVFIKRLIAKKIVTRS